MSGVGNLGILKTRKGNPMRMQWEMCPNPQVAQLHIDQQLPNVGLLRGEVGLQVEGKELLDLLLGVHGIQDCSTSGYTLQIIKGNVFDWDEVKPRVESVLESYFGSSAS